jgi:hypothetical protein
LVSLSAWIGDIDPYDVLDEVWVQISGIPPKWSNWRTFNHVSSSLGRLLEVDWNSLFTSFFGMVRVNIACKDASRIPKKRVFEMKKKLYLIQFRVEGVSGGKDGVDDNDGDDGNNDNDDLNDEDKGLDVLEQDMNRDHRRVAESSKGKGSSPNSAGPSATTIGSKKVLDWVSMFQNSEESKKTQGK